MFSPSCSVFFIFGTLLSFFEFCFLYYFLLSGGIDQSINVFVCFCVVLVMISLLHFLIALTIKSHSMLFHFFLVFVYFACLFSLILFHCLCRCSDFYKMLL